MCIWFVSEEWTKEEKSMFDEKRRDFDGYYAHLAYVREEKEQAIAEGLEQGLQQGLQQGLEQGLEQGREEGIEQGIAQERVKTISIFVDLVKEGHLTREMGASKLNLSEQEFEKYLKSLLLSSNILFSSLVHSLGFIILSACFIIFSGSCVNGLFPKNSIQRTFL